MSTNDECTLHVCLRLIKGGFFSTDRYINLKFQHLRGFCFFLFNMHLFEKARSCKKQSTLLKAQRKEALY